MIYIKTFENHKIHNDIYYHCTQKYDYNGNEYDNSDFDDGFYGNRIYKTNNTVVEPIWFSKNWYYAKGDDIKIIKCKLNINNTFNPTIPNHREQLEIYALRVYGDIYKGVSDEIKDGNWEDIEISYDCTLPAIIYELGYDSFISYESNNNLSIGVFDKNKIQIISIQ